MTRSEYERRMRRQKWMDRVAAFLAWALIVLTAAFVLFLVYVLINLFAIVACPVVA